MFGYIKRGTPRNLRKPTRAAFLQGFSLRGGSSYAKSLRGLRGVCGLPRHPIAAYSAPGATKKTLLNVDLHGERGTLL